MRVRAATSPRTNAIIPGSFGGRACCPEPVEGSAPVAARAASMRAWAPPRQMWVMASASASAASAGLGGASSRRMRVTMAPTWALSARPLPDTAALTSLGVWSAIGSPRRAATTIAMPLAWAVPMIVLESERAKTRSIATASGRCSSSQASMPRSMWTRRWETCSSAEVRSTLTSTSRRGRPTLPSTTPMPQRVSPGSIPSTRMSSPSAVRPSEHLFVRHASRSRRGDGGRHAGFRDGRRATSSTTEDVKRRVRPARRPGRRRW